MSLRLRLLGSGSSGNATLVEGGGTRVLIDAGLGPRSLAERLQSAGVDPASLDAVLLSHEHGDHARGAAAFSAKWGVPLVGSRGTYAALGLGACTLPEYRTLTPDTPALVGALHVRALAIPHDAAEPLAFVLTCGGVSLGHATDLGHLQRGFVTAFGACDGVLIESNYDPGLLRDGPYPWSLKERILSPRGHLSNGDIGRLLERGLGPQCRTVVLAHLSRTNNHPELCRMEAERALTRACRADIELTLAEPTGSAWITLEPPAVPLLATAGASATRQLRLF
jgi:phosphoribosyl 1,2-cyclic phosphodiesterase